MANNKPYLYSPLVNKPVAPKIPSGPSLDSIPLPQPPKLYAPKIIRPYVQKPSPFLNYDDPYQINSIADIVLTTFNKDMKRKPLMIGNVDLADIPILNIIPATFQYINDAYVSPISQGQWGAVGLNTLTNFGETLDTLANPVKGLILEGGQGFLNAMGWGGEGRKNYDFNTGNIISDIALELVVDPLNYVTLFGKGAVSAAMKGMVKGGLESIGKEAGQELADAAYKRLAKIITQTFMEGSDKPLADLAQEAATALMKKNGFRAPMEFTEAFLKGLNSLALEDTTYKTLSGLRNFIKPFDALDDTLTKLGVGVPYAAGYAVKKIGDDIAQYAHSSYLRGLKNYFTPSGNLDVLQFEDILSYTTRFDGTAKALNDNKDVFKTKEIFDMFIKEAVWKEKDSIHHFLKTELKDIPNANMESKVKLFAEYLSTKVGLDPAYILSIIQDINNESGLEYQWLYSWMRTFLDEEGARLIDQRNAIWTMYHDLKAKITDLKGINSIENLAEFEKYLGEKYGLNTIDWLNQADGYEVILGSEFDWIKDYYSKSLESLGKSPIYAKRKEITSKVYELLRAPKSLEGETRFKLIDDFIRQEHGVGALEYLERLKAMEVKYPGSFTDYIKKLENTFEQLQTIDRLSKEYAIKQAIADALKVKNDLVKTQADTLMMAPDLVRDYINTTIARIQRIKVSTAPIDKLIRVVEQDFKNIIDKLNKLLLDERLTKLSPENSKFYADSVRRLTKVVEGYLEPLERALKNQSMKDVKRFNIAHVFDSLQDRLNTVLDKIIPNLKEYNTLAAKADALNKVTTYDAFLKKSTAEFKTAYEMLVNFMAGRYNDPAWKHLQDKIIRIEKVSTVTEADFYEIIQDAANGARTTKAREFFKSIYAFFMDIPESNVDYKQYDQKTLTDFMHDWFEYYRTVDNGKKITVVELKSGGQKMVKTQDLTKLDLQIFEDSFINDFEELMNAIATQDFPTVLQQVDSIIHTIDVASLLSTQTKTILQPLRDMFTKYDLAMYKPFVANIDGEEVWYHFKLEQDWVLGTIMTDPKINEFMKSLLDSQHPLGQMFKNKVLAKEPEAERLAKALNSYMNYRDFLNTLYNFVGSPETGKTIIDKDMLGAFQSTLQKYAMRDPDALLKNFEGNFYHIMKQTEEQMNSMTMEKSLSLDSLIKVLEKDPKYAEVLQGLEAHHAMDDAVRTYYVTDAELAKEFKKLYGENVRVIHLDIESTGFDGTVNEITEIGMHSPELGINKYEEVYAPTDLGQDRAHPAKTLRNPTVGSELEMLQKMMAKLDEFKGQNVVINMHNGFEFDRKFLINRFEHHAMLNKANPEIYDFCIQSAARLKSTAEFKFSDSLKMLQQKYGYTVISEVDRTNLYYVLRDFVNQQHGMGKLIQPIDTTIARQLKDMGEVLREALKTTGAVERYEEYFNAAHMIYDVFKGFKAANRDLSRTLLSKSVFADELFQKTFGIMNITQALNTKPVYGSLGEIVDRELIDGIKHIGVKKHLDEKAIKEYFGGSTMLSEAEMLFKTNIARDIDREFSQLRHSVRLKGMDTDVRKILATFIELARESDKVPAALKDLKVHTDYRSNFAILRKLYTWGSESFDNAHNVLEGILPEPIRIDIKELLENPSQVRIRSFVDDGSISQAIDLEIQNMWNAKWEAAQRLREAEWAEKHVEWEAVYKDARDIEMEAQYQEYLTRIGTLDASQQRTEAYRIDSVVNFEKKLELHGALYDYEGYYKTISNTLADYTDIHDMLKNLGEGWDDNGAHRAVVQVRATSLKETYNMLAAAKERHFGIKSVDEQFRQVMKYHKIMTRLNLQQMDMVLALSDEELFAHLVNGARRLIILNGFEMTGEQLVNLPAREQALKALGIDMIFKDEQIYLVLNDSVKLSTHIDDAGKFHMLADGKVIPPPKLSALNIDSALAVLDDPLDEGIRNSIRGIYDKFFQLVGDYDTGYSPHAGSIGELTHRGYYKGLYENLPDEVKQLLPHVDMLYADEFFHGASFNHSVLGSSYFRRGFHEYTNSDIISMLTSTMTQQAEHLKAHVEYMNMFFDKSMSIDNGILKDFSDEVILEALQGSREYRLTALVNDPKLGAKVVDINPKTVGDIAEARRLGAVLMSYQTFSTAFGAINSFSIRHSNLNWLHKINYLYKMGYIMTPGAVMRNAIDSVVKNYVAAAEDPTGITKSFTSAWQLYWKYRRTAQELIKFSTDAASSTSRITKESTERFFNSGVSPLTKELYDFVHGFDVDGPSGGMIKEFEEYFMRGKELGAYGMVTQIINNMMEPNKVIEQVARLAEYMWAIEKGMPSTKAYALIAKTHFDYTIKTDLDKLLELIFPFYTFTMNNIHFWMEAFDRVPALGSVLRDVYTPIWNLDDYSPEELKYNRSLQYQILSGNLPLERVFGDWFNNMTLKLNPSFMDVFQLATDPINSITGKLQPLLQTSLDFAGAGLSEEMKFAYGINTPSAPYSIEEVMQSIGELLPIAGPLINQYLKQGPKYYERSGNPLNLITPSIFGATADSKKFAPYQKKPYRPFNRYTKKARRNYYKKPRRYYAKRSFSKATRYYPKKVYSSVGYSIDNFYNKLYTKTGKSRLNQMMIPVTGQTLKYRIKDMFYYYR